MGALGWMLASLASPVSPVAGHDQVPTPTGQKGVVTVRDASDQLNKSSPSADAGRPVPIGNAGQWFGPQAYPPAAIRAGAQGRVAALVAVDSGGHVTGCTIATSSGSSDLDAATCTIATQRMSFTPAHDPAGKAIAGEYRLAINWRLPNNNGNLPPMATTLVSVGSDGAVLSCASMTPTPLGDLCGAFPTGRKLDVPATMRGKVFAIGAMVRPLAE